MNTDYLNIKVPSGTQLAVVGDIHGHEYQFNEIIKLVNPSPKMWLVSVGDILDKGFGQKAEESICNKIRDMESNGIGFIVKGNHELKTENKMKHSSYIPDYLEWLFNHSFALSFVFDNSSRITVLHGGVLPSFGWKDLIVNDKICYVRNIDSKGQHINSVKIVEDGKIIWKESKPNGLSWHESYDGRFGYIVAGHEPLKNGKPKFYKNSCNIDTACYHSGIMTCQIISSKGLETTHSVIGPRSFYVEK